MTHQLVSCLMFAKGKRVEVHFDWWSSFGSSIIKSAHAKASPFLTKGFQCDAYIDASLWKHNPRPWESIIPIVTNGIRRMKREREWEA